MTLHESSSTPETQPESHTEVNQFPIRKFSQPRLDVFRSLELGVLSLLVVSNVYFGWVLRASASVQTTATTQTSSAATAGSTTTPETGLQLQPASVPQMVGGC